MTDLRAMRLPELDDALHYGVKGMKWGLRKEAETKGEKRAEQVTIKQMNKTVLPALNRKYRGQDLKSDPKVRKAYEKDAQRIFDKLYQSNLDDPQSRVWSAVNTTAEVMWWGRVGTAVVSTAAALLLHDDLEGREPEGSAKLVLNELGHIVSVEEPELKHHGILGMKWGRRRSEAQLANDTAARKAAGEAVTSTEKAKTVLKEVYVNKKTGAMNDINPDGSLGAPVSGPESSSQRYARLKGEAKGGGAKSWSEQDLKFFNSRTEALSKVDKMFQEDASWIKTAADKVIKTAAQKTMQDLANGITNKYITTKVLESLNDNSAAKKAESKTPVDYVAKHRAKSKK